MQKIRPRYLPAISFISDFDEINLRTYVNNDDKPGVFFLNIEGAKFISVFVAKLLSGLPYEKANITRTNRLYTARNNEKQFYLDAEFTVTEDIEAKTELDKWLTERYCLYLELHKNAYRYDIHHKEWELKNVAIDKLEVNYKLGDIDLSISKPDCVHYSDGIKVIAWDRQRIR